MHLMLLTVPPSLHVNRCLLSILLPAIFPYCACFVEHDHAAASSVLAVRCISGEMNRALCCSFWLTTKVLLVLICGVQQSRKMEPRRVDLCLNKPLCTCMSMRMQIICKSLYFLHIRLIFQVRRDCDGFPNASKCKLPHISATPFKRWWNEFGCSEWYLLLTASPFLFNTPCHSETVPIRKKDMS